MRSFLIADIRGYTAFTAEHGDEAASRLAQEFAQIVAEAVTAWSGRLVELRGDEALAVFASPRMALLAAAELQDAFADETAAVPDLPLYVGIGLDAGEAVPVGDGYRGAALNLAARLCGVSRAGEVHSSVRLVELAGPLDGRVFEAGDWGCCQFQFKGTNTGPLGAPDGGEVPPTGKVAAFPYCVVARFEDGVIVEFDEYFDRSEMLSQLGLA